MAAMAAEPQRIRLHRTQADFYRSDAMYRGFVGGRGSGKTYVGAFDLLVRAEAGRTYLIGSPTSVLMRDVTFPTFTALARQLGLYDHSRVRMSPYPTMELTTGATIRFRSAEDPEKMRGPNLSGIWLDEASLMEKGAYDISIACLREGGTMGWLAATFTPKGLMHWTYDTFGTKKPNTALFQCRMVDNPFLPAGFEAAIREQYGEGSTLALQELEGQFVNLEGAEWPPQYFDGPGFWFDDWPPLAELMIRVVSLDPSKGTDAKTGDYQALVKYGRDKNGVEYVEADLAHRPMTAPRGPDGAPQGEGMIEQAVEWIIQFDAHGFALETNQMQILLKIPLMSELGRRHAEVTIAEMNNHEPKPMRIRRLGPPLSQRHIRFKARSPGTRRLVDQLRQFPVGEHDDGPDALEMVRRLAINLYNQANT